MFAEQRLPRSRIRGLRDVLRGSPRGCRGQIEFSEVEIRGSAIELLLEDEELRIAAIDIVRARRGVLAGRLRARLPGASQPPRTKPQAKRSIGNSFAFMHHTSRLPSIY